MEDVVGMLVGLDNTLRELQAETERVADSLAKLQADVASLTADHTTIGGTNWR